MGAWESQDPDGSHVRVEIGASGQWRLRDDGGRVCENNDYGFVPATASGVGTFLESGDVFEFGADDVYCYPRDGRGRQFVGTFHDPDEPFGAAFWPDSGVMIDTLRRVLVEVGHGDPGGLPSGLTDCSEVR